MKVRVWFFSTMLLLSLWALGRAHAGVKGSARRPGTRVDSLSRGHTGIKKFVLTVKEGVVEMNGVRFPVLTLNGTVPGPEIRVKEGDRVKIRLVNRSRAGQTLIFQFQDLDVPFAMTGPGQSQKPVGPGEEFTYELIARPRGTYLYHCGVHPTAHLDRGLYGAMIIEAPDEPKAGRELVYILDEWNNKAARGKSAHEMGHPRTAGGYDIVTANGKMIRDHVLLVLQGEAKKGGNAPGSPGQCRPLPPYAELSEGVHRNPRRWSPLAGAQKGDLFDPLPWEKI